jgi:DNA-binding transcriptional LysR family regulator
MDLNEVYVFTKVVELQSFTKAAKFLGIPKSRISRQVSSLERDLGIQLLFRTTRQLELTPAGKKYFSKCHKIMATMQEDITGSICITAPEDIAIRFFPKITTEFNKLYPRVSFDYFLTGRRVDLIKEPVDLALRVGRLQDSTLKSRKVGEIYSVICATPQFLSMYGNLKNVHDLESVPAIGFGEPASEKVWNFVHNKKELTIKPHCPISTNSMDMLLKFALEGKGVAVIPHFIAREYISQGSLVQLFYGYHTPSIPIHFLTAPQKEIPLKVKRFIEFSSEILASNFS